MKLYVCWGTFPVPWPRKGASSKPAAHPCKRASDALAQAGHAPGIVRAYGLGSLPDFTRARREVRRLTGQSYVPVLVLDRGEVVQGADAIVAWAREHPA